MLIEPICKIMTDGSQQWTLPYLATGGRLVWHRLDGPAIVSANGSRQWWVNNRRHRLDGPAIEHIDGHPDSWWIDGDIILEMDRWLIKNDVDLSADIGKMAFKLRWL